MQKKAINKYIFKIVLRHDRETHRTWYIVHWEDGTLGAYLFPDVPLWVTLYCEQAPYVFQQSDWYLAYYSRLYNS